MGTRFVTPTLLLFSLTFCHSPEENGGLPGAQPVEPLPVEIAPPEDPLPPEDPCPHADLPRDALVIPDNSEFHFITYGDAVYEKARRRIVQEARDSGWFHHVEDHSPTTTQELREVHKQFFENNKRGGGYWIWKPHIILRKLETMRDGDFLAYVDAGSTLNLNGGKRLSEYLALLAEEGAPALTFEMDLLEKCWTKADLLAIIDPERRESISNSGQRIGGINIFRKSAQTLAFVRAWRETVTANAYHLVDDSPSIAPNDPCFQEHRHDQSIFSILSKQHGVIAILDETWPPQRGRELNWPFLATRLR